MRRKQYDAKLWLPTHQTQLPRSTAWVGSRNLIVKVDLGGEKGGDVNEVSSPTSLRLAGRGGMGWGAPTWRCCRRSPSEAWVCVGGAEWLL